MDPGLCRWARGLVGGVVLALTVAGCGGTTTSTNPLTAPRANAALAAKIPASIKSTGKIVIATDSTYAPSEFLDADGKTVIGFDVDLFNAVAAKLGLNTEWRSVEFGDIIPGVRTAKYNIGVSSFTITADRERQVTMVSYFDAGTQWVASSTLLSRYVLFAAS